MKSLCDQHHVRLLVLLEPMSDVALIHAVRLFLRFDNAQSFLEGKIWVFWFNEMSISFSEHAEQLVHMQKNFVYGYSVWFSEIGRAHV